MPEPAFQSTSIAPSAELRPFVRRFLVVENSARRTNTLLPDVGVIAGFRFQGESAHDGSKALRAVVTGLRDQPRTLTHAAGSATMLAVFTPSGAAHFVREPLGELFNSTMPLDAEVRQSQLQVLEEQLAGAAGHLARAKALEQFLLSRMVEREADRTVAMAVACIRESQGRVRIDDLAQRAGLSQSALERRFLREIGTSPKKLASIVRLRNAVRLRMQGSTLTEAAYGAGYSDQSHFIREFRRFSGSAPEEFFQSETAFC